MKKFKEYFESKNELKDTLSIDEVCDQFLRLEEILNCTIRIIYLTTSKKYVIGVSPSWQSLDTTFPKILKELETIKIRMENMFPIKISIINVKKYPYDTKYNKTKDFEINIKLND